MKVVFLSCAIVLGAAAAYAQDYLDCRFAPGWEQSGPKRQYTADNLFDYRDGAAEGYLIFGFARMQGIDCKSGPAVLSIDVSEMADADSAYGMFAANRDPAVPIAKIGMGGQLLRQSLLFAKGKYFVEIVETGTDKDQTAALKAFSAKMLPLLAGRDTPPETIQWFPAEGLVSVRLVPESVLGLKILKRGYVATYDQGQAFVVREESPDEAAQVMKKLRERFAPAAPAQAGDEAFEANAEYLDGICIFRKGSLIGGYTNLPDAQQAATRAGSLASRVP